VSAKDLKSPVLVFEENLGLCESWRGKRYVWSVRAGGPSGHICFHYLMIRDLSKTKLPTTILLTSMTKVVQVTAAIVDYSWLIWYKEDSLNSSKLGSPSFETLIIRSSPRNDTMPTNNGLITDFSK
jgi:hypothetical protein